MNTAIIVYFWGLCCFGPKASRLWHQIAIVMPDDMRQDGRGSIGHELVLQLLLSEPIPVN